MMQYAEQQSFPSKICITDNGYICFILMKIESRVPNTLRLFTKNVGPPKAIIYDSSKV